MLQLGSILYSKGFSIVVPHSELRPPNPLNHPEFIFHLLSDGLSGYQASIDNLKHLVLAMNSNCRAPMQDYMVQLMEDQKLQGYPVSCIIYDSYLCFVDSVATHLKIPSIVLRPNMAASMLSRRYICQLQAENRIPFPESRLLDPVPELHPLRFKDLPYPITNEIPEWIMNFFASSVNIRSSVAIILNTTDCLEHLTLSRLQQRYKVPCFLQRPHPGPGHVTAQGRSELGWRLGPRGNQSRAAGLFCIGGGVSPGQELSQVLGRLFDKLVIEILYPQPIHESGHDHLLIFVPDLQAFRIEARHEILQGLIRLLLDGHQLEDHFPEGVKALLGESGLIVKWAPQKKVLAHSAVGGFWSHCGSNSTIESICEGVPMICRPHFADQSSNARYLTYEWKVGLEIENVLDRGSIEKSIRRLMVDAEGKECQ
ncbi:UDP-glucose iridoid glucosyltransferase-like [Coffea eugenioides]|uniref:UDP-glucose iridoid glucosyltransferase-like n=1 Tax=Coffea eugenioides TaxID=49369 RepID=UPI000F604E1E|nr:UDP-glucose iridoid glucosyltransferase-like [Coffea eugenioides]